MKHLDYNLKYIRSYIWEQVLKLNHLLDETVNSICYSTESNFLIGLLVKNDFTTNIAENN